MTDLSFPEGFLWGSALSAHQAEGNNKNNDWWVFEHQEGRIKNGDKSGLACDHYNRFDSDYALFSQLGQNAHRNGFEWSRIIPEEDYVDQDEIEHYHKVLESLKRHNLTAFMTVHHFTIPQWFAKKGGFLKKKNLRYFKHYCEILAKNFPELEFWNTINEPMIYTLQSFLSGEFPPAKKSFIAFMRVTRNIMHAHAIAYHTIKEHNPHAQVGLVKNFPYLYQKYFSKGGEKIIASYVDNVFNQSILEVIKTGKVPFSSFSRKEFLRDTSDFIGVNYYNVVLFKTVLGIPVGGSLAFKDQKTTQMGWGVYPEGLYHAIMRTHKMLGKPIYVTENGIATLDDEWRKEFIIKHLLVVHKAIKDGANVEGYFYWSSIDNFEWAEGFEPRFGLIGINYDTQERIVRDSAKMYGNIAKNNALSEDLIEKYANN
ncbi:MAG: glycoside hydrolase family 1 protein [Candidatus Heimdallarchaeaceae archaeon]